MRWIWRGLLIFAGLMILLPAAGLAINHYVETAQRDRFYASRPMLRAMHEVLPSQERPGDPAPRLSAILYARVPLGSSRSEALRILGTEGIQCSPATGPVGLNHMVCSPWDRPTHVVPRWHIEIRFDQDDRLAGGRVLALKATG